MAPTKFILASNSPRRKQLLQLLGLPFAVVPADVDETRMPGEDPLAFVARLAESKALAVSPNCPGLVLAADTIVVHGDAVLGKPGNAVEAREMLVRLRGRVHTVYSAIAFSSGKELLLPVRICTTQVPMRNYLDEEMDAYIASGDPMDKAGSYAIQHPDFRPVDSLSGCYASVMGLPLCHITHALAELDVKITNDVPALCQQTLGYHCPVFARVLAGGEC